MIKWGQKFKKGAFQWQTLTNGKGARVLLPAVHLPAAVTSTSSSEEVPDTSGDPFDQEHPEGAGLRVAEAVALAAHERRLAKWAPATGRLDTFYRFIILYYNCYEVKKS